MTNGRVFGINQSINIRVFVIGSHTATAYSRKVHDDLLLCQG